MSSVEPLSPYADRLDECERLTASPVDEEWANGLTHGVGFIISLLASAVLLWRVFQPGFTWLGVGCLVYALALNAVYAASTLSHWVEEPRWRPRLRAWDQGVIYLLITANFTPFAIAYLEGPWHAITIAMWSLALWGFFSKVTFRHRIDGISLWLYLGLGWMSVLALPQLIPVAPREVIQLVVAGGVAYTIGTVLLINDHRAGFLHVGWHLFVMAGSACHYVAVWQCVSAAA